MIKSIIQGPGIEVAGGYSTYPYVNMNNPSAGMVRYNGTSSNFEIYDGDRWYSVTSLAAAVSLDRETQSVIEWVKKKRNEEMEIVELAKENTTVKDLVEQIKEKQDQLKVITTLIKNNIPHHPV